MKLNLACGKQIVEGFEGVDIRDYGQVHTVDLKEVWPWEDGSVEEVHCRHFLQTLTNHGDKFERVHFFNELHRVLKIGGTAQLIIPAWNTSGGYGSPYDREEFKEVALFFLSKEWRDINAPETNDLYTCNFNPTYGYNMHPGLQVRNAEYQQHAIANHINSALDIIATVTKL